MTPARWLLGLRRVRHWLARTPDLADAVAACDVPAVEAALSAGADPNPSGGRRAILVEAVMSTHDSPSQDSVETVRLLLDSGAEVRSGDDPAIVIAVLVGVPAATVRLLLDHGADPNAQRSDGIPALVLAAKRGHTGLVEELLRAGAAVDAPDSQGRTALMHAVERNYSDIVVSLMCAGADQDRQSLDGCTAYALAHAWGRQRIMFQMGDNVVGPDLIDAPRSVIEQLPTGVRLLAEAELLEQVAGLVDYAIAELGDIEAYTGYTDEQGREVAELLRHPDDVPGSTTLKGVDITGEQRSVISAMLHISAYGPRMRMPTGWTGLEIADLYEDFKRL